MVDEFGGPATPGIGFAIGMERIIPLIKDAMSEPSGPDLLFCPLGDKALEKAFLLTEQLRAEGLWVEMNHESTSLRSQMRKANRINAKHIAVVGEDELAQNEVTVKNMSSREETRVALEAGQLIDIFDVKK